ncbi:MAG TPA: hypothetical protein VN653_11220, partial [Anaerolineales bacterium]|nr:hypothetical protein [Anaerolineales bacterium]
MNKLISPGRIRIFPSLILLLICGGLGFALFFFSSSPARAALFATMTPTQENLWAFVNLPKATYTPTPLSTPTGIPTLAPLATETPGVMAMDVFAD